MPSLMKKDDFPSFLPESCNEACWYFVSSPEGCSLLVHLPFHGTDISENSCLLLYQQRSLLLEYYDSCGASFHTHLWSVPDLLRISASLSSRPSTPYSVFNRRFSVVSLDTFRFIRTVGTVWTSVINFYTDVSTGRFTFAFIRDSQFLSVSTNVAITVCMILHVFSSTDVFFVFWGLRDLIILWLYVGNLSIALNKKIVFFTFVFSIRNDLWILKFQMALYIFKKGIRVPVSVGDGLISLHVMYSESTPWWMLYAGFNWPFNIASSFILMKVASGSVFE